MDNKHYRPFLQNFLNVKVHMRLCGGDKTLVAVTS